MKTLALNIIGFLAVGISLVASAATFPNRFTTNNDDQAVGLIALDTNAVNYAISNGVAISDFPDLQGVYTSLEKSSVWTNFVDGILFQPRFGTNTSLKLGNVSGYRGNYTPDCWGIDLTNVLGLQLPVTLSNVTVVAMVKSWPLWLQGTSLGGGSVIWGLSNTNSGSGIVASVADAVQDSRWLIQETYHFQQWPGANGSFSNLFQPLRMSGWDWNGMGAQQGQPMVMAWQRDVNGAWRMYLDTVQGKISLNNPTLIYQSPTNATDPLSFFSLGYDGITNEPNMSTHTNLNVAAVFIFNTTNFSAVIAGYKAALWSLDSDAAEFWYGDSRLNDTGIGVFNPGQYYQRRLNPSVFFSNKAQGGARADIFLSAFFGNGGLGEVTNVPRDKIKNLKVTYSLGINDGYLGGETGAQIFQNYTNAIYPWAAAGARVRFCDTYQAATNASFIAYSLTVETNIFVASQMVRTNIVVPIAEYVPLRDAIPQSMIQTNGLFSIDGVHLNQRTNSLAQQMIADLIAGPEERSITNGPEP
jgi:hypothetical protein